MKAVPGGTKMGNRTFEDVKSYVEWQSQGKCTVLSAKTEQHFNDLGVDVRVWNVKTDTDGDWWDSDESLSPKCILFWSR